MNEELYDLYKRDIDFKHYVDAFCQSHGLGLFEALDIKLLQLYGEYIKQGKGER